jgi:hypothetical protein
MTAFDVGGGNTCAAYDGGRLSCIGDDSHKQLGPGDVDGMWGFDGP